MIKSHHLHQNVKAVPHSKIEENKLKQIYYKAGVYAMALSLIETVFREGFIYALMAMGVLITYKILDLVYICH